MFLQMTDETGRVIAQGSGEQFMKALSGEAPARKLTPMRPMNIKNGFAPIPLAKSHMTASDEADRLIRAAQQKFGRFQVLRRLEEAGIV
ncbi:hypothetical protein MASR2M16_14820 [Thauera terpenica]